MLYNITMNILDELKQRGIFSNITNVEKFNKLKKGDAVYIGFDPTAESLHLGNYIQISMLKRFESYGFKPVAVLGGATGMIGDPSGKSQERNLLSPEKLIDNKEKIRAQLASYGFEVVDNYDFYKDMGVLDFLRNVGKLININYMLNKEVVSSRLETGISFTEFSYQLIQGWDFKSLYDNHGVRVQVGGSDQWGNITAGVEIIRKTVGDDNEAVGITTNLLTTASGKKFGKSEGNAIWIDRNMVSPYTLYQYLLNTPDSDVEKILKWVTYLSVEEVDAIVAKHNEEPRLRHAQKILAFEIVKDVHDEDSANEAIAISEVLFGKRTVDSLSIGQALQLAEVIPSFEGVTGNILDVLVATKAAQSKREAREFVSNGAVEVNGVKVTDLDADIQPDGFDGKVTIIKRGKKKFLVIKH